MIPWWRTTFGELELEHLKQAMAREHISQGPVTEQLETALAAALNVPYAVATTSGSAALLLALLATGIGRDDEVIMPNRTWVATAHAALLIGGCARLVDVTEDRPVMEVREAEAVCTERTRALLPVHLNGRATDMRAVNRLARERGLVVIEDACQALFSRNEDGYLGTQSDIGCFSLGLTKLISTGQGGFAVTRSKELYYKLKLARNHGVMDQFTDRWNQMGFNLKFTDLLASFGLAQLRRSGKRIAHVNRVYAAYRDAVEHLPFVRIASVDIERGELPIYAEVLCEQRERLAAYLKARGIQTRHVPPNISDSPYIPSIGSFRNSRRFAVEGLYLPCGPEQPIEDVERVIAALRTFDTLSPVALAAPEVPVDAESSTRCGGDAAPACITYVDRAPSSEEFRRLRAAVGWPPLDPVALTRGLASSLYAVCACMGDEVLGCGRLVGDGALYFDIVDVVVLPQYQRAGVGTGIVKKLMGHVASHATRGSFVGLAAARGVAEFYEQFGFKARRPESPGMFIDWPGKSSERLDAEAAHTRHQRG